MATKNYAIQKNTLNELATNFQESRGIVEPLSLEQMVELANTPLGNDNRFAQFVNGSIEYLTNPADFGDLTTLPNYFCQNQSNLRILKIPDTITKIGDWFCHHCFKLRHITLSENLVNLGGACFGYCYMLEEIIIPQSLKHIPNCFCYTAAGNTSATGYLDIYIPKTVETFGGDWFINVVSGTDFPNNTSIRRIFFEDQDLFDRFLLESSTNYTENNSSAMLHDSPMSLFVNKQEVKNITLPSAITQLSNTMFPKQLTTKLNVVCEGNITTICRGACQGVKNLDLSNCTSVPTLITPYSGPAFMEWTETIKVPALLYDEWIQATNWANYTDYIIAV